MAVRDTDEIIGQEKLRKIAEKKEQDRQAVNAVLMFYQAKAEEQNKRNQEYVEEQVRNASNSEEKKEPVTVVEEKKTDSVSADIPVKEEYAPVNSEELTAVSEKDLVKITPKDLKKAEEQQKKSVGSALKTLRNRTMKKAKEKNKTHGIRGVQAYEKDLIIEKLNRKEESLTEAEKEEIYKRRLKQSEGFDVKQTTKPYAKEPSKLQKYLPAMIIAAIFLIVAFYFGLVSTSYKRYYMQNKVVASSGGFGEVTETKVSAEELNPFNAAFQGITTEGLKLTFKDFDAKYFFTVFGILLGVGAAAGVLIWSTNSDKKRMRVGHEHGLKRLASKQDMKFFKKQFMDPTPKNNMVFSRNVGLSLDNTFSGRTANVLIIGGTGTGKTFKYVKPNILQQNCSMIITDPSGDIFDSFGGYLLDQGFNVYIFNVKELELSNFYNPLMNVYDARGEISEVQVDVLVDLYMKNAKNGQEAGGGDPFWDKSEKAFLTALVYYVLENDDIEEEDKCFNTILRKAQDAKAEAEGGKKSTETKLTSEIKAWQKEMEAKGRAIKTPLYYDTFLIAPDKTANTILITTAVDLQLFATKEVDRITRVNKKYPDFNIDFDTIAQIQSYVFLCIPQQHDAYNFLISMFYSQLYGRLYEYGEKIARNQYFIEAEWGIPLFKGFDDYETAEDFRLHATKDDIIELDYINNTKIYKIVWKGKNDKEAKCYRTCFNKEALLRLVDNLGHTKVMRQAEMFHGDPALPIHCNFMLDEFKNIGEIPNFLTTLSTSRKYRIGSHVIIQDVGQIKTMYKEEEHQTLIANVDTLIFLGSSLPEDKEYIQKALGKTTILQKSVSSSKTGNSTSYTPTEVDLMSIDEISAINDPQKKRDDCIVMIRDYHPFVDHKFFLFDHPNWSKVQDYKKRNKEMHFNPNLYYLNNQENEIYTI